jgi:hypothetical protein
VWKEDMEGKKKEKKERKTERKIGMMGKGRMAKRNNSIKTRMKDM